MNNTYILIDGSYYVFYRYFALVNWWKLSHKDEPIENIEENEEFIEKFKDIFKRKIIEIPKKIGIPKTEISNVKFIVGLDCKRQNIWRNNLYSKYKGTRDDNKDSSLDPGKIFKIVYDDNLFKSIDGIDIKTVRHKRLEADDCIAILTNTITDTQPDSKIIIITSDTDYLQLIRENVQLINLKYKSVDTPKNNLGCPHKNLLYKIIIGDKSDNIPSVFKKCGPKKTLKYIEDIYLLDEHINSIDGALEQYKLNRRLIDFKMIPESLKNELLGQIKLNDIL